MFDLAQKLHQTQPDNAQARLFYAQTLQFAKKYELAFAEYTAAARTLKNSLELWRGLLQTALILQKISELSQFAAETANLFPNHALGYYYLAVAQNLQSQPQKALDNATEALLWATDDLLMQKLIYQELANAYTLLNLPDKAAQARQKAEK